MQAIAVKLEGELLSAIERAKPPGESVPSFVRAVLRKSLEQDKAREAANTYIGFVESHPEEQQWLDQWERADLTNPPAERRNAP
jgi:hypothetical protein